MEDEDEFLFEALLQEHKTQQEFKSLPSRIVVVEGMRAATAHLDRRPADSGGSREDSGSSGSRREGRSTRRSAGSTGDIDMRELHDSLIKLFSPFGSVTYVNEHLFAAEDAVFVFFTHIRDAQEAKEEVEKDIRKHVRPVINTLGPQVEKGEPDWNLVKVRYEEPKTLTLPVTAGHKSSRHLWVGSIDDTVVTSATLEAVFGAFGTLTDRPHINVGRQQGFVDFQTVYEAVDALTHMNGVFLGCLPLEIRFGRQEFGKVLWIGGLDDTITERRLWQACYDWGMVKSVAIHASKQCASITFSAPEEAQLALDMMQGVRIGNCKLKVDYFRTARTFPGPEFSSPTAPFSPTLRSSKGRGSVPPTSPPPVAPASSLPADRDKDTRERDSKERDREREREREKELLSRAMPPAKRQASASTPVMTPSAPGAGQLSSASSTTTTTTTTMTTTTTPPTAPAAAAAAVAGPQSPAPSSSAPPPLPSNLALSAARPQKRKADDRLPGASSSSVAASASPSPVAATSSSANALAEADGAHSRRKREKLDTPLRETDSVVKGKGEVPPPLRPTSPHLTSSTSTSATVPSPPSASPSSSSLASLSPSSSATDRRREGTPPHRYFVPSPEEWYIPGSSKRMDSERGGSSGGAAGMGGGAGGSLSLSVSGGRGEPSGWNPPPREPPLPPGRMSIKSRSAEWSDGGGSRSREWSDVAPPPPRGGPRDWDRGSREWSDRGGGIGISGGGVGRDGGRGGIPPPHAYPPFSPPPFKPRGRLPGHRRGPKGYPQEWEPHDVRGFEALPPYEADFHPLDYEGGHVPGHRLAPKAYREWEYEGRFESGPPPLYEPDYRPEYADGQMHEGDRRYERGRHERDRDRDREARERDRDRDRERDVGPPPYHPSDLPPPRDSSY